MKEVGAAGAAVVAQAAEEALPALFGLVTAKTVKQYCALGTRFLTVYAAAVVLAISVPSERTTS